MLQMFRFKFSRRLSGHYVIGIPFVRKHLNKQHGQILPCRKNGLELGIMCIFLACKCIGKYRLDKRAEPSVIQKFVADAPVYDERRFVFYSLYGNESIVLYECIVFHPYAH